MPNKQINAVVSFTLLAVTGFLFFYKYGIRLHNYLPLLYFPYLAILFIYVFKLSGSLFSDSVSKVLLLIANVVLIVGSILLFTYFPVGHLDVDRWSVITNYWDTYIQGENPYSSRSHMGNYYGSYPFYFILQFPFYYLNEIGWSPIFAFLLFQLYIGFRFRSYQKALFAFILSMAFLSLPYEIATRSTIFANSVYVLIVAHFFIKAWQSNKLVIIAVAAFLTGLMVCTRPIYGLVFLMAAIPILRTSYSTKAFLIAGFFSIVGLLLPFIHLYSMFPNSIMTYNPVSFMATHFVPTYFYPIYLIVAVLLGFKLKEMKRLDYAIGLFLFFVVGCYAIRYILLKGWHDAIFEHFIDISYFFMAVPFLIVALCQAFDMRPNYTTSGSATDMV